MVSSSKLLPPEIARLECQPILHPWTKSCLRAQLNMYLFSIIGSAGYFALLYFFQYVARALKKKKQSLPREILKTYVRSCLLFSSIVASCYIGLSCLLRNIFGKFYYYTIVFIPATLAGLAITNENARNRDFFSTTFANMALESRIRKLEDTGTLRWTQTGKTIAFMILTSTLSFLLGKVESDSNYFWFFTPPKPINTADDGQYSCFHKDKCIKNILGSFTKYFSTGLLLKMLKLVFSDFKRPKNILLSLFKPKTYSFAAFLGLYAFIYQSTRCLFYQKEKKHLPVHDMISGFLSGATYRFEPNISIFNSAAITIVQILIEMGCRKKILPNLPYNELAFALSCGILFHARVYMPHYCPSLMHYIMSSVTNKKADYIVNNYRELLSLYNKNAHIRRAL